MTTKRSSKSRLSPSRTKSAGSQPARKSHKSPPVARTAAKKAKPAPKAQRGERPARGPNRAEQMLQAVVAGPIALADLAESFGIQEHSCRAIISLESRAQGLVVRTVGGLLTVVE